jgi:hypothetical protein
LSGSERIFNPNTLNSPPGFAATRFFSRLDTQKAMRICPLRKEGKTMAETTNGNGNGPDLIAYHVPDRRNAPWLRIGAAWLHKRGGGYAVRIELVPLDLLRTGELVIQLRQPEPKNGAPETPQE